MIADVNLSWLLGALIVFAFIALIVDLVMFVIRRGE
jgi:hypothetical protein